MGYTVTMATLRVAYPLALGQKSGLNVLNILSALDKLQDSQGS